MIAGPPFFSTLLGGEVGAVRTRGSHRQFCHPEKPGTVTIAGRMSKELSPKMRDSILKQAGIEKGAL